MVKRLFYAGLFLSLALLIGTIAATASEITLTSSHNLTLTIAPFPNGSPLSPGSGTVSSSSYGYASSNPDEDFSNYADNIPSPGTATVSLPPETYTLLRTQTATATATSLGDLTFSSNMVGWGPTPYGNIFQSADNKYSWSFTAPAAGYYLVGVTDSYNIHFQLRQEAGSAYPLWSISAYSSLSLFAATDSRSAETSIHPLSYYLANSWEGGTLPLSNATLDSINTEYLAFIIYINKSETASGYLEGYDYYSGQSMEAVPLPSSLLLLGSGVVGLLPLRRRRRLTG